jgi:hypothetical protein
MAPQPPSRFRKPCRCAPFMCFHTSVLLDWQERQKGLEIGPHLMKGTSSIGEAACTARLTDRENGVSTALQAVTCRDTTLGVFRQGILPGSSECVSRQRHWLSHRSLSPCMQGR